MSDEKHLLELNWQCAHRQLSTSNHTVAILNAAADELSQYFSGARRNFSVPLQPHGTGFQLSVWSELQKVGWGETCTYGEIAERLGRPKGFRAVGGAVGRNPIPIFIPCHRIVGANGALTGFSGGLDNKQILLGYEGR
ncbi:MAG: methylated-DNA--[protein]-cysteine S-methyltransferase [Luminiphilus sp.]|nr:methylated-DNA--[protein]-cysteine S-methyltransferase [Luminiphilus sp.]